MVYIKIPENAKPGEAIELKLQNVYSRCTRCGTEISFVDSYYRSEDTDEFIPQRLYCARCVFICSVKSNLSVPANTSVLICFARV